MLFKKKKFSINDICSIKSEWSLLEKGNEMTYFQSFHWYLHVCRRFIPKHKNCESIIYLIQNEDGKPVLIAPLWIIKKNFKFINKKGCYLIGRNGWSDYLNLIYNKFYPEAVDFLIEEIKNDYSINNFIFEQLKENTSLYKYINSKYQVLNNKRVTCVELNIPSTVEDYNKLLSKSVRQNIRTAFNRIKSDNLDVSLMFDDKPDFEVCRRLRNSRVVNKNKKEWKTKSLMYKLIKVIYNKLILSWPKYLPFEEDPSLKFISIYINNEICAFFNYGVDYNKSIYLLAVGTNDNFKRYSPGIILMYEFIKYLTENNLSIKVDFTRGDEKYKYQLGGINHYIYNITFKE